jgi:diacylglycerol kinase family enzyme
MAPEAQVAAWNGGREVAFDVCVARGPFGTEHLLEGLGCGLFTWGMQAADANGEQRDQPPAARLARVLSMLRERVASQPSLRIQATLDGDDLSGDYLLLEAMNTQFIGPNLFLAPGGHPGDGLLDVVTVTAGTRDAFTEQLASWHRGALRPADWPSRRGRRLTLRWTGFPLHLDDRVWPDAPVAGADPPPLIEIEVEQGALRVLVPASTDHPPVP